MERRTFIKKSALAGAAGLAATSSTAGVLSAFGSVEADLVVLNAKVFTVDSSLPLAEAFAVKDGKFLSVGKLGKVKRHIGDNTRIVDAKGRMVMPGFFDAHMHPKGVYPELSIHGVVNLRPPRVNDMDDLIRLLREKAEVTPEGLWVKGTRYSDGRLGRHPTRADLDKVSTVHPVIITHSSGHVRACNSFALKMAGIGKETLDPAGGAFGRDSDGMPNGVLRERAIRKVLYKGPKMPKATEEEKLEAFMLCFKNFAAKGITSVGDAATSLHKVALYQKAYHRGQPIRVNAMILARYLKDAKQVVSDSSVPEENLCANTIKVFHGNSLSGKTCWLQEPYDMINPSTGKKDYCGIPPARSQERLDALIWNVHDAGFQVGVHSNGDREIPMVLLAIERAQNKKSVPDIRHRIEHCSVVNDDILNKIKELGVVVAPHSYVYEHGDEIEEYGADRWDRMFANKSFLDMGIMSCGNSDFGVSMADPMLRIQSMVTRKCYNGKVYGASQRVTVEQALKIWTMGSAYSFHEEKIKGSITEGKLADFIVLSRDPREVDPETIKDIEIVTNFIGGEEVYAKDPEPHYNFTRS